MIGGDKSMKLNLKQAKKADCIAYIKEVEEKISQYYTRLIDNAPENQKQWDYYESQAEKKLDILFRAINIINTFADIDPKKNYVM